MAAAGGADGHRRRRLRQWRRLKAAAVDGRPRR